MIPTPARARGRAHFLAACALIVSAASVAGAQDTPPISGDALYRRACAACHGPDGRGAPVASVAFETPLPDLTDCSFATREPDADWHAIVRDGGPARAFDPMMPAFGEALGAAEIEAILGHVRGFCRNGHWPRGELNLPRPLFTEKAYPEDEAVVTTDVTLEGPGEVTNKIVYEQRLGSRTQWELVVPIASHGGGGSWTGGVGDVAIGVKRVLAHGLRRGTVVSVTGEVVLPTGNESKELGRGFAAVEPFLTVGQLLARDGFLQVQAGFELPLDRDAARDEAFCRFAIGRTFSTGAGTGRTWSPMIEVLAARELAAGERVAWDIVPEMQVTLSRRQHIMFNAGVRLPLTDSGIRSTRLVMYVLWDWFDGGLFEGW